MKNFGTYFGELRRRKTNLSLREWCKEHGFDAGNISKMERGRLPPPPTYEKLGEYARALGLEEASDEWFELLDRAAVARKEVPADLQEDQRLMDLMPVLFRAYRAEACGEEPISDERLKKLLEILKKA